MDPAKGEEGEKNFQMIHSMIRFFQLLTSFFFNICGHCFFGTFVRVF